MEFILFLIKLKLDIGVDYDWITNPLTNYKYDINTHWSEIQKIYLQKLVILNTYGKKHVFLFYMMLFDMIIISKKINLLCF